MRHRLASMSAAAAIILAVVACNALSGVGDLGVCEEGQACTASSTSDGGATDAAPVTPPSDAKSLSDVVLTADGSLPPNCSDGQKACEGRVQATCANNAWNRTPCVETCVDTACAPWPSCRNASGAVCGPNKTSCCESKELPGGTFKRQSSNSLPTTVSPFSLDVYEVTVGRFRAFVDANAGTASAPPAVGAGAHPKIMGSGWLSDWDQYLPPSTQSLRSLMNGGTWTSAPGANEQLPITNVSWFVAFAFCVWDGGARLPTYAEWSFAALGGDEQRVYPWSTPPTDTTISSANAAYTCNGSAPPYTCPPPMCSVDGMSPCDVAACTALAGVCQPQACYGCDASKDIVAVGSFPKGAGRFGHLDLGGNVAELLLDAHLKNVGVPGTCNDCASLMGANPPGTQPGGNDDYDYFVVGGAWNSSTSDLQTSHLDFERWNNRSDAIGFRCAR